MNSFSVTIILISIHFSALSGESLSKNTKIITVEEEPEPDLGVSQCYKCQDDCIGPLEKQNCTELHELIGHQVKTACLTFQQTLDDGSIYISRGCVHDEASASAFCTTSNLMPNIKCSFCRNELCNQREEDKGVKECYYCDRTCSDPMEKQNCFEALGQVEAQCQNAVKADGEIIRRCVRKNDLIIGIACRGITSGGGNCTMCDTDLCNNFGEQVTTTDIPTTSPSSTEESSSASTPSESTPSPTPIGNSTKPSDSSEEAPDGDGDEDGGSKGFHKVSIVLVFALSLFTLNCY